MFLRQIVRLSMFRLLSMNEIQSLKCLFVCTDTAQSPCHERNIYLGELARPSFKILHDGDHPLLSNMFLEVVL